MEGKFALFASGEADQSVLVFCKEFKVDARRVVEPFGIAI